MADQRLTLVLPLRGGAYLSERTVVNTITVALDYADREMSDDAVLDVVDELLARRRVIRETYARDGEKL